MEWKWRECVREWKGLHKHEGVSHVSLNEKSVMQSWGINLDTRMDMTKEMDRVCK